MSARAKLALCVFSAALLSATFAFGNARATTREAGVINGNCTSASYGPAPAAGSWTNFSLGVGTSSADGFSVGGSLGGSANATSTGSAQGFNSAAGCFRARTVIADIVISGPGSDVSTQVSAHLNGTLFTSTMDGNSSSSARAEIRAQTVGGIGLSGTKVFSSGTVQGLTNVDTTLTTLSFTAPVGAPFAVRMEIESEIVVLDNWSDESVSASSDFSSTMSFIEGSPVFALPAGYTANSADGEIVDNLFVGGPAVPALGVPAIAILTMLMGSLSVRQLRMPAQ